MAGSLENTGKLRELIDKFKFIIELRIKKTTEREPNNKQGSMFCNASI